MSSDAKSYTLSSRLTQTTMGSASVVYRDTFQSFKITLSYENTAKSGDLNTASDVNPIVTITGGSI